MEWKRKKRLLARRVKYLEIAEAKAKNPEWKQLWRDINNKLTKQMW